MKKSAILQKNAANCRKFDCVRLLTCHSAEGGDKSLIYRVSLALQKPVKGYIGVIQGRVPKLIEVERNDPKTFGRHIGRSPDVISIDDGRGGVGYGRVGQSVMAGIEFFDAGEWQK